MHPPCYICYEPTTQADAVQPCATCKGSVSTVHKRCFLDWAQIQRTQHPGLSRPKCTICQQPSDVPVAVQIFMSVTDALPQGPSSAPISIAQRRVEQPPTPAPVSTDSPPDRRAFWNDVNAVAALPSCAGCGVGTCDFFCPRARLQASLFRTPSVADTEAPLSTPPARTGAPAAARPTRPTPRAPRAAAPAPAPGASSSTTTTTTTGHRGLPQHPAPVALPPLALARADMLERQVSFWADVAERRAMPEAADGSHPRWGRSLH